MEERKSDEMRAFVSGTWLPEWGNRVDYVSLDGDGKQHWDIGKIYPDTANQFRRDVDQGMKADALALKYPKWAAITSRPADASGGHPVCF